jgi:UDP-N-acetyl-D-glucosamine dehydrogenase
MEQDLRFKEKSAVIGVVGLGYVGLPLILAYARAGFRTVGFDIDESKVASIQRGRSYIKHIAGEEVKRAVDGGRMEATTDFARVAEVDALILCVPTPLSAHWEPDLSFILDTLGMAVPHLRAGQIISLESTTYPGTTDEEMVPRIEATGLKVGEDIFVVYSPEREDPGNTEYSAVNIPKVVGGFSAACLNAGILLYGAVFDTVVAVSSTRAAELTKLLENIYRAVNIGLVNELKVVAERMGIDIWEVIGAAATKPFGFTPFYPGPGLGGHCIPIDPFYLTWKAREYGLHTRFIELAGEINRGMPDFVVKRTAEALNQRRKPVNGSRILIMGLAYKANVDDMRESPTFHLMDKLQDLGAVIEYCDPHIPEITPTREHSAWTGKRSIEWREEVVRGFDAVLISTHHAAFDLDQLADWSELIIDTRNAMSGIEVAEGKLVRA